MLYVPSNKMLGVYLQCLSIIMYHGEVNQWVGRERDRGEREGGWEGAIGRGKGDTSFKKLAITSQSHQFIAVAATLSGMMQAILHSCLPSSCTTGRLEFLGLGSYVHQFAGMQPPPPPCTMPLGPPSGPRAYLQRPPPPIIFHLVPPFSIF